MTRQVIALGLALASRVPALAGESAPDAAADARARKLLSAASELADGGRHADAEKACIEALSLDASPPLRLEVSARLAYVRAALACENGDLKGCLAHLGKAIAASQEAILWANDNRAKHFADIVLLEEESPVRRQFLEMTDLANYDKDLRRTIQAKCQQAAKEGKLVLLDFYGGW